MIFFSSCISSFFLVSVCCHFVTSLSVFLASEHVLLDTVVFLVVFSFTHVSSMWLSMRVCVSQTVCFHVSCLSSLAVHFEVFVFFVHHRGGCSSVFTYCSRCTDFFVDVFDVVPLFSCSIFTTSSL